jgi:hypothetical protein
MDDLIAMMTTVSAKAAADAIVAATPPAPAEFPSLLVRISARQISDKELENFSIEDIGAGKLARLRHSEMAQGFLFGTIEGSDALTLANGLEVPANALAGLTIKLPLIDHPTIKHSVNILADIFMEYHKQLDGAPMPGGSISFAVTVKASGYKLGTSINDGSTQVEMLGNVELSGPMALPSTIDSDIQTLDQLKAATARSTSYADSVRVAPRRTATPRAGNPVVNQLVAESMEDLATSDV